MTTGGRKVGKSDLLELARALGDEEALEGESMLCIFQRCLERAHELNAPTHLFATRFPHPKVREWCAQLMDYAEERRREMLKHDDKDEKWTWYTVYGMVRDSTGRPCVHNFAPGAHTCMRGNCHVHIDEIEVDESCRHKFVDSVACLLCGVTANVLKAKERREAELLQVCALRSKAAGVPVGCFASHAHPNEPARCTFCNRVMLPPRLPPLAMTEDRTAEQLKADGDDDVPEYDGPAPELRDEDGAPMDMTPRLSEEQLEAPEPCPGRARGDGRQPGPCEPMAQEKNICLYCGRPIIDLSGLRPEAHADRVRALLEEEPGRLDPRERAERWAQTRGNKGAQLNG